MSDDFTPDPNGPEASGDSNAEYWDSEEALEALKMERDVHSSESDEELTKRLLSEAAPGAAQSIIHLAMHSQNDNTRFNASKYIVDWMKDDGGEAGKQAWESLVGDVVSQAEVLANGYSKGQ